MTKSQIRVKQSHCSVLFQMLHQCLTVQEKESPSDLALLDFISAAREGPTKDIDLVERKLSWRKEAAAKWRVENCPNSIGEAKLSLQGLKFWRSTKLLLLLTFHEILLAFHQITRTIICKKNPKKWHYAKNPPIVLLNFLQPPKQKAICNKIPPPWC